MRILILLAMVAAPVLGRAESKSTQGDKASSDGKYILSDVHVTIEGDATPPTVSKAKAAHAKGAKKKPKKEVIKGETH